jgi:VIT1/CCC1 family predicted Fe2+/Mn2+ transporter
MKKIKVNKDASLATRANTLRAGVLGANDGILTVVGVLFSVGAATTDSFALFIAALADLIAVAFSMAGGEYASVSAQRDTEASAVRKESRALRRDPAAARAVIVTSYTDRGVTSATAAEIADEFMANDPLPAIVSAKYSLDPSELMNPWAAAFASMVCAALGGLLPLLALTFINGFWQWPATIIATVIAVGLTGYFSAELGHGFARRAIIRNIIIGLITITIHYLVGLAF